MASTNRQYKDSARLTFGSIMGIIILTLLMLLTSCYGTYYISDSEYNNERKKHLNITYWKDFEGCFFGTGLITNKHGIYWGWYNGYYYYYGKPHYYPWYHYYNTCPPSHYNTTTHIIINKPVNRPTHRPNRPKIKPTHRPNIKLNNKKVIIKSNNGFKRTNKTTIKRKSRK